CPAEWKNGSSSTRPILAGRHFSYHRGASVRGSLPARTFALISQFLTIAAAAEPPLGSAISVAQAGEPRQSRQIIGSQHAWNDRTRASRIVKKELSGYENFANIVAGKKELNGGKIAEQVLNMPVIENSLQPISWHPVFGAAAVAAIAHFGEKRRGRDGQRLHFQCVLAANVITIKRRIRAGILGVKEGQNQTARPQHGPQAAHHRFHQRLLHEICHVPSQHSVERLRGVSEVLGQESLFVENFVVVLVPVHKRGITGGEQHVFAVN